MSDGAVAMEEAAAVAEEEMEALGAIYGDDCMSVRETPLQGTSSDAIKAVEIKLENGVLTLYMLTQPDTLTRLHSGSSSSGSALYPHRAALPLYRPKKSPTATNPPCHHPRSRTKSGLTQSKRRACGV